MPEDKEFEVQNADEESGSNIANYDSDDDKRSGTEYYRRDRVSRRDDEKRPDYLDDVEEIGEGKVFGDYLGREKKGNKKRVEFIFDEIKMLKKMITNETDLSSLKSEDVSQKIIKLLHNTECNSSKEFDELLKKYLEPDHYEGIGIQFKESDTNYPKKTTFEIGHVFLGTFASEIGLEEGDVIVLEKEMNIFELVVNLRNGKLDAIKEIVRSGQPILNHDDFKGAGFNSQIGVTTAIDLKKTSGEFNCMIRDKYTPEAEEFIGNIKEIVTKKKIFPDLFDSLRNYSSNKTGKSAKSLEENIKKWAKTYSKNSDAEDYSKEASQERAYLEIDTVAYLAEFMMSLSSENIKSSDVFTGDEGNIFQSGVPCVSLKTIQSDDKNKRVLIACDDSYYSVFCQIKTADGQWVLQYWDAKGLCDPNEINCALKEDFKKQLDQSKRLSDGNADFIVHDGTCGIGAAAICHEFLNGQDCEFLKVKQHPDFIKDFIDKKRGHSQPTSNPQAIGATRLRAINERQGTK